MQAYGIPNPHAPQPRAKRPSRGGGIVRGVGYVGAVILTIAIIVAIRVGLRTIFDSVSGSGSSSLNTSAQSFTDPLTSNKNGWATNSGTFFKSDGYHFTQNYLTYAPVDSVGSVDLSVKVSQLSGDIHTFYGIVFRRISKGNYYIFGIDGNGKWGFFKVVEGTETDIVSATANSAITPGLNVPNTLAVQARGSHFIFSVNGTQVGEADDTALTGKGLAGVAGADNVEVVFTDFSLIRHD
jgi:hypothetical protein